jgi:hypothetical protein
MEGTKDDSEGSDRFGRVIIGLVIWEGRKCEAVKTGHRIPGNET